MKKLLFQLDTDQHPAVFDTVVAYDGGADHVSGYGGCTPDNIRPLVEGTIFTRAPKDKKNTAIFIGGSDMPAGENLLEAVKKVFFADFRVSVMLAGEGASVTLTSRNLSRAQAACRDIKARFGIDIEAAGAATNDERGAAIADAGIVFCTGAAGVQLLDAQHWQENAGLRILADANATPPLGIGGTEMTDRGKVRNGKIIWGAIGFGTLKLVLHRACIARLFEQNDLVLDAEEIYALAKTMENSSA